MDRVAHRAEVDAWRERRYSLLRRDLGWLTLAGFAWLRDGPNRIGSSPEADVLLADGPPSAGVIDVDGTSARVVDGFGHAGPLVTDSPGEPTILEVGALRVCVLERGGRLALRTWDLEAEARRTFGGIPHFPVDPVWHIEAQLHATPGRTIDVPDVLGIVEATASPATLAFDIGGTPVTLEALEGGPDGELWLVFGDRTNGDGTYGGGRFLYTAPPAGDRTVVIDFNLAYNPPCVFSPYATCPLPWPANRLPERIEAGERYPILDDPGTSAARRRS
jgi:uncharacterized protein (DUF1684 family)